LGVADEVDAHRAYDLAVADEHVGKMAALEFIRGVVVIGLAPAARGRRSRPGEWRDRSPIRAVIARAGGYNARGPFALCRTRSRLPA
jgi:hypothetical protein